MYAYSIGVSALSSGQRALDVIGQNVANANTEGYHRQEVSLVSQTVDPVYGNGVNVAQIRRFTDTTASNAYRQSLGEETRLGIRLTTQQQTESLLRPGTGAIDAQMESLFNGIEQLTAQPEDSTQRRILLSAGSSLAQQFNSVSNDLDRQRSDLGFVIRQTVGEINDLTPQISELNARISSIEMLGGHANDLRDRRDQLVNELGKRIDLQVVQQPFGVVNILGGNVSLVVGDMPGKLTATAGAGGGNFVITDSATGQVANPKSGKLAGLLEEHNVAIPDARSRLDTLARTLIANLDSVQATGLGNSGPLNHLDGQRGVSNTGVPLATLNLPIAPQAGDLAISITNLTTGNRTLNSIAIDPATQSLQDIATAINTATGGQLQATINPASGTLQLQAQSGFAFDFAGRLPTTPPTSNLNGTTTPKVTGTYRGASNDTYSFEILGNGTIGSTPGLQLQVRDGANNIVSTLNVGAGYNPGDPLDVGNGIAVRLSAGTSNNGTFSTPVIADPDTSGILATLGLNSFFSGSGASDIAVRSQLLADPTQLSVSRSGQSGDSGNLQRMAALRDQNVLGSGSQTMREFFADIVGTIGQAVVTFDDQQTAQQSLQQQLQFQQQAVAGVDINEQMLDMLRYQRMIEAASRYLAVVNTSMDSILEMIN